MQGFEGFDLEVDSVADLQVPVGDESLEEEAVYELHMLGSVVGSGTGSFRTAEAGAPVVSNAQRQGCSMLVARLAPTSAMSTSLGMARVPRLSSSCRVHCRVHCGG